MRPDLSPLAVSIDNTYGHRTFYRYSSYDTPFWDRESTRPGRWHATGEGPAQYLTSSADGAWAELIRAEELFTEEEVAMVSVNMWMIEVSCTMIVDYSTFEKAEAAGFDPEALIDDDYSRCQREGARLRARNFAGVLAPSAALPGEVNLTLFGPRLHSSWGKPPVLRSFLPATVLTKGAPPRGLLPRVRQLGMPHDGLVAFELARARRGTTEFGDAESS
jgi:RES domain-containing protein